MKHLPLICLLFLTACRATIPSEAITNNTIKELNAINQTVERIEKESPAECKTDSFKANIASLRSQIDSVKGQVKNIDLSCKTEKQVLEHKITIRNIIIGCLIALLIFFIWLALGPLKLSKIRA